MKTLFLNFNLLVAMVMLSNVNLKSQNYETAMQQNISKLYQSTTAAELQSVANTFYLISQKEQDKWLPLYYSAYALTRICFFIKDADDIDQYLDAAQEYMDKLVKKEPEESEVYILQSLIYSMRITSPQRGMKYSGLSNASLDKAEKLNASNPRVPYCRGNNLFHTPTIYGGGKSRALPLFEKAKQLYEAWKSPEPFWPNWGEKNNLQMLEECTKENAG